MSLVVNIMDGYGIIKSVGSTHQRRQWNLMHLYEEGVKHSDMSSKADAPIIKVNEFMHSEGFKKGLGSSLTVRILG